MRIYTASAFANYRRVRAFNDDLRAAGHKVTWDWTRTDEFGHDGEPLVAMEDKSIEDLKKYAEWDRDGVVEADLVIALFDIGLPNNGIAEFGAHALLGKETWVLQPCAWGGVNTPRFLIFTLLDNVECFELEDTIRARLGMDQAIIELAKVA